MPKITQTIHIKLTNDELIEIFQKKFGFAADSIVTYEIVPTSNDDEWIDVPVGWDRQECPTESFHGKRIRVIYDNGTADYGLPTEWSSYWANGRIKKYRLLK